MTYPSVLHELNTATPNGNEYVVARHELEFNKGWVRENPDLALKFVRKFHVEYSEKYKISINDEKYYITYVADLPAHNESGVSDVRF
jgi:hypothetical protein